MTQTMLLDPKTTPKGFGFVQSGYKLYVVASCCNAPLAPLAGKDKGYGCEGCHREIEHSDINYGVNYFTPSVTLEDLAREHDESIEIWAHAWTGLKSVEIKVDGL